MLKRFPRPRLRASIEYWPAANSFSSYRRCSTTAATDQRQRTDDHHETERRRLWNDGVQVERQILRKLADSRRPINIVDIVQRREVRLLDVGQANSRRG